LQACHDFKLDHCLVVPSPTTELGQSAARPLNAGLINVRAQQVLSTSLRGVEGGLRAIRQALMAEKAR
jgi:hypothetical protein